MQITQKVSGDYIYSLLILFSSHLVVLQMFSVSPAHAFIFINQPIPPKIKEIADSLQIRCKFPSPSQRSTNFLLFPSTIVIPFTLESLPSHIRNYHPSSLRWILFNNYLKVSRVSFLSQFSLLWQCLCLNFSLIVSLMVSLATFLYLS